MLLKKCDASNFNPLAIWILFAIKSEIIRMDNFSENHDYENSEYPSSLGIDSKRSAEGSHGELSQSAKSFTIEGILARTDNNVKNNEKQKFYPTPNQFPIHYQYPPYAITNIQPPRRAPELSAPIIYRDVSRSYLHLTGPQKSDHVRRVIFNANTSEIPVIDQTYVWMPEMVSAQERSMNSHKASQSNNIAAKVHKRGRQKDLVEKEILETSNTTI